MLPEIHVCYAAESIERRTRIKLINADLSIIDTLSIMPREIQSIINNSLKSLLLFSLKIFRELDT